MRCPDGQMLVAIVTEDGRLAEVCIPKESVHIAREQGWYVFADFEQSMRVSPQGDGDDGA